MADKAWKQHERQAAALIGGRRYPANSGYAVDCESAVVVVKRRAGKGLPTPTLVVLTARMYRAMSGPLPSDGGAEGGRTGGGRPVSPSDGPGGGAGGPGSTSPGGRGAIPPVGGHPRGGRGPCGGASRFGPYSCGTKRPHNPGLTHAIDCGSRGEGT